MRYLKKENSVMIEYCGNSMRPAYYRENGWVPYAGTLSLSRLDLIDGEVVELPIVQLSRRFSRRSLYLELEELGLWDAVEGYMEANGYLKEFTYSLDISEDHPVFAALCEQLAPVLAEAGEAVENLLARCVLEDAV